MQNILFTIAIVVLLACSSKESTKEAKPIRIDTSIQKTEILPLNNSKKDSINHRILEQSVLHSFSDENEKDTFRLTLTGDSILNSTVLFEIIDFKGKIIHSESFPSTRLIGYGIPIESTNPKRKDFILKRVNEYFDEKNFLKPAIGDKDSLNTEYSDEENWVNVKDDSTSIGFIYLIGEEDVRHIAFSKKQNKVVLYHNCC